MRCCIGSETKVINNLVGSYSVYAHINKLNGLMYIGITSIEPSKRWANGHGYIGNKYFNNAINKYGWDNFKHVILLENIPFELANIIEFELINKYNTTNSKIGYNLMNGGSKNRHTDYTKRKISENHHNVNGKNNPFYGKKHTYKTIEKIKETLKGRFSGDKSPVYQRKHTLEEKEKMKGTRKSIVGMKNPRARKINQYDLNGTFIRSYWGCSEVKELFRYDNSGIAKCCKGKVKTSYGFIWRYSNE
jgi:group I intron endonuclease